MAKNSKTCPTCKKPFPKDQTACPHCGADSPRPQSAADSDVAIDWAALDKLGGSSDRPSSSDVIRLEDSPVTAGSDAIRLLAGDSSSTSSPGIVQPHQTAGDSSIVEVVSQASDSSIEPHGFLDVESSPLERTVHPPEDAGPSMSGTVAAMMPASDLDEEDISQRTQRGGHRPATMVDIEGAAAAAGHDQPAIGSQRPAEPKRSPSTQVELATDLDSEIPDSGSPSSGTLSHAFLEGDSASDVSLDAAELTPEEELTTEHADLTAEEPVHAGRRRDLRGWVGGGVLGVLLGMAASFGLWLAGLEPPASLRKSKKEATPVAQTASPVATAPATLPATTPPTNTLSTHTPPAAIAAAPALSPLEAATQHLGLGQLEKAVQVLAKAEGSSPELLARRGEARWLHYLSRKHMKHETPADTDPDVAAARKDLEGSKSALGLFWLGQMEESLGKPDAARATYERGRKEFPQDKARFDAALDRLEVLSNEEKAAGESQSRLPTPPLWVSLVVGAQPLQPTPPAQPTPKTETPKAEPAKRAAPERVAPAPATPAPGVTAQTPAAEEGEAGADFWKAVRLARGGQYDKAIEALKQARQRHEQRRFGRLNQPQNPVSDPTEQIFLRACDEILQLWQVKAQLKAAGLSTRPADIVKAVQTPPKPAGMDALVARLRQEKLLGLADTDVSKAIDALLADRKKMVEQVAAVRSALEEAKIGGEGDAAAALRKLTTERQTATAALAGIRDMLKSAGVADEDTTVARGIEKLADAKKAAETRLKEATDKLEADEATLEQLTRRLADARLVDASSGRADLVRGVEQALARTATPASATSASAATAPTAGPAREPAPAPARETARAGAPAGPTRGEVPPLPRPTAPSDLERAAPLPGPRAPSAEPASLAEPVSGEQHYATGCRAFWARRYDVAEKEFTAAIRSNANDARFYYFLGLARMQQGKRTQAYEAFRQGGAREMAGNPSSADIGMSLERVQGQLRRVLDREARRGG